MLRRFASLREHVRGRAGRIMTLFVPGLLIVLVAYGAVEARRPARAVLVGASGIRPSAHVEARVGDGLWQTCEHSAMTGTYRCADLVSVTDATTNLVNDAAPSWAFITPSIAAYADTSDVEVRVTRTVRLGGRYWVAASSDQATLQLDGARVEDIAEKREIEIDAGEHSVVLTASVPARGALQLVFVAEDTLVPARPFLAAPPDQAPASVTAIAR